MGDAVKKLKYAGLNLVAPGIGHFAMKRWGRGLIYFLSTLACFIWMLVSFFQLLIGNIYTAANGGNPKVDMLSVFLPMGLIVAIWIVSYIDIMFIRLRDKTSAESEKSEVPVSRVETPDLEGKIRREVAKQLRELRDAGKIKFVDEE
jgi:hypothetical protein